LTERVSDDEHTARPWHETERPAIVVAVLSVVIGLFGLATGSPVIFLAMVLLCAGQLLSIRRRRRPAAPPAG
jgi:hypothetical protein